MAQRVGYDGTCTRTFGMSKDELTQLALDVRAGRETFKRLYEVTSPWMGRLIRMKLSQDSDFVTLSPRDKHALVREMVDDAATHVYNRLQHFDPQLGSFKTWMDWQVRTITQRHFRERARARRVDQIDPILESLSCVADADDLPEDFEINLVEVAQVIAEALGVETRRGVSLRAPVARTMVLSMRGLTETQISEELKVSRGGVRNYMIEGRRFLTEIVRKMLMVVLRTPSNDPLPVQIVASEAQASEKYFILEHNAPIVLREVRRRGGDHVTDDMWRDLRRRRLIRSAHAIP